MVDFCAMKKMTDKMSVVPVSQRNDSPNNSNYTVHL